MQGPHKVCMDGPCLYFALTTATSPSFSADASPGNDNQIPFIQTQTIKTLYFTLMQQRSEPGPKEGRGGIGDSALTLCTNPVPIVQNNPVPIVQNNPIPIVQNNPSIPGHVEAPVATRQLPHFAHCTSLPHTRCLWSRARSLWNATAGFVTHPEGLSIVQSLGWENATHSRGSRMAGQWE